MKDEVTSKTWTFTHDWIAGKTNEALTERSPNYWAEMGKKIIDERYKHSRTIADISSILGISTGYFSEKFIGQYGVSPKVYMLRLKVDNAKELLESGSAPIRNVALEVGFADRNIFRKVFKRFVGVSPSEYRTKVTDERTRENDP